MVLFPELFGPTSTVSGVSPSSVPSRMPRRFLMLTDVITP